MIEFYNLSQVADIKCLYDLKRKHAQQLYEVKRFARSYVPASAVTGQPMPHKKRRLLAQAAKEKNFKSRYWVTRKQIDSFNPPLTLLEGAEPTELISKDDGERGGVPYSIYNVDQIVEANVVAEHLAAIEALPFSSS